MLRLENPAFEHVVSAVIIDSPVVTIRKPFAADVVHESGE